MQEMLNGFTGILIYFVVCASMALLLHYFLPIPSEVFRKLLHMILLGSLSVWVVAFSTWWISVLTAVAFAIAVFPILTFAERFKGYSQLLTERKSGEIKHSLLWVFGMYAVVACICWGWLGDKMLALASIYAWGFGDAAAALIGTRFGRHPLNWKYIDGRNSAEGTLAMFVVSFVSVFVVLALRQRMPWYGCLIVSVVTAAVSAATELYTRNGMDTVTCPLAAMTVLLPLTMAFGGIGL